MLKILDSNNTQKPLKIALIDPDKKNQNSLSWQIEKKKKNDFVAVFCGGSFMMDSKYHARIEYLKKNINV